MTKLELLRREKNLSQVQLSNISGVEQKTISMCETEKSMIENSRLKTLCKFAKALDVKIYDLIEEETGEFLKNVSDCEEFIHDPWFDGSRLAEMRYKMKMTQQDVANELFTTQSTIAKWERWGVQNVNVYTLCRLCISLNCHPCDLIDDKKLREEMRGLL